MGKYLNVGNAGFQSMRKGQYIDKTGMIRFINQTLGTMEKLTCVSRPRRFGKSFAAKMLCAYYDRSCDSKALFAGCRIAEDAGFEEHLNRYDVLYLDITLFIAGAADIRNVVKDISKKVIGEIRQIYPEVGKEDTLFDTLSSVVQVTGNKFMLLFTGASSCPAMPDKKHRASARCGKLDKNSLTSQLDVCFRPVFPAP